MEANSLIQSILALVLVLGLIGLTSILIRKYSGWHIPSNRKRGDKKRLKVVEMQVIDAKHRLVLVKRDDKEHLLLLGPQSDLLVEGDIIISPDANSWENKG